MARKKAPPPRIYHAAHPVSLLAWIRSHYRLIAIVACIALVVIGFSVILFYKKPVKQVISAPPATKHTPPATVYYSPLTGEKVANEAAVTQPATAIMIENSPDARPQSGLKSAGVVFEAIAEGGITRFLALYQQQKPQLIGPVRSLRPYYIDWLTPFQPSVAHVGGSLNALNTIRNGSYRDIDEFFNSQTYWRANDRYAPHNVYTSFAKLDALNAAKGYTSSTISGFERKDSTPSNAPTAANIDVTISGPTYNSHYDYDPATHSYLRSQGREAHVDREEGRIAPQVVVVIRVAMSLQMEDGYREQITTTGSGEATIFQDGIATPATWHKDSAATQFTFTDAEGKPIPLNRGQTWITAIPTKQGSVTWQ